MKLKDWTHTIGVSIEIFAIVVVFVTGSARFVFADSLAETINCQIYAELVAQGSPIPAGFHASLCAVGGNGDGGSNDGGTDSGGNTDTTGGSKDAGDTGNTHTAGNSNPPAQGGGGPAPACEDSIDNDGDGLIDMSDPGCSGVADTDEVDAATFKSTANGGGGMRVSEQVVSDTPLTPQEDVASCDMYLTAFIRPGAKNDSEQVKKMQKVLHDVEGAGVEENGLYDGPTLAAVHAFQTKYAQEILTPWGIDRSTGFVYLTTRKKINELFCSIRQFPLTDDEQQVVTKSKLAMLDMADYKEVPPSLDVFEQKPLTEVVTPPVEIPAAHELEQRTQTATAVESAIERPVGRIWRPISNLFKRIFHR